MRTAPFGRSLLLAAAAVVATVTLAAAQSPDLYTSRSAWQAAAGPVNTVTFENLAPANGFTAFDTSNGLLTSGVRFVGGTASPLRYYLRVVDSRYSGSGFNWGSGAFLHGPPETIGPGGEGGPNSGVMVVFPAGITAAGADIMSFAGYASMFRIEVDYADGSRYSFDVPSLAYPQRAFAGVVSSRPMLSIRFRGLTGFPSLDNVAFGGRDALGAPQLTASGRYDTYSISWTPAPVSATATAWRLEVSATSFGPPLISLDTPHTEMSGWGPPGTYFVRVRALRGTTVGPFSNEVVVTLTGPCVGAPDAPTLRAASAQGHVLQAEWTPATSGCSPTGYVIRGGSRPGATDLGSVQMGAITNFSQEVLPGVYYLTVVAQNGPDVSPPSNEVRVNVDCAPPPPPGFSATSARDHVTLAWEAPLGPVTRYVIEVGSITGASDIARVSWPSTVLQTVGVQAGLYFLRVRAENSCGLGLPSIERALTVSP